MYKTTIVMLNIALIFKYEIAIINKHLQYSVVEILDLYNLLMQYKKIQLLKSLQIFAKWICCKECGLYIFSKEIIFLLVVIMLLWPLFSLGSPVNT